MNYIYVLAPDGKPLMPTTRYGKVRRLLKSGKAVPVQTKPFTIQLTYEPKNHVVQDVTMGIDPGRTNTGAAAVREDDICLTSSKCVTRNKKIPKLMEAIEKMDSETLHEKCQELSALVYNILSNHDSSELEKLTTQLSGIPFSIDNKMEQMLKESGDSVSVAFALGSIYSLLQLCGQLNSWNSVVEKSIKAQTEYKDQILELLYESTLMLHGQLASKLKITPDVLSDIMRSLRNQGDLFIETIEVNEHVTYYVLSYYGRKYMRMLNKNKHSYSTKISQ